MSATPTRIILKHTALSGEVPHVETLLDGELAINIADHKLFYRNADNTLETITIDPTIQVQEYLDSLVDPLLIKNVEIDLNGDLVYTYLDNTVDNLGHIEGATGATGLGFKIEGVVEYADQLPTRDSGLLDILQKTGTVFAVTKGEVTGAPIYAGTTRVWHYTFGDPEDETSDSWADLGEIEGAQGPIGPVGEQGPVGRTRRNW